MGLKDRLTDRFGSKTHEDSATERPTGFPRRTLLKASTAAAGMLGMVTPATATDLVRYDASGAAKQTQDGDEDQEDEEGEVDSPEGFSAEVLAPHAPFADEVSVEFQVSYEAGGEEVVTLDDASTVIVAKVTWEPGGTSGWHTHPGPVIVNIVQGELEIVHEGDPTTHTYTAGEAFLDTGEHNEVARNPSETESTVIYATALGVPAGGPATEGVKPPGC